ncbi:hypothetical protein ACTHSQ_03185 [Neisseria sp. P0009.S008]|jgi:hypothetical protein|uniref:hypothetical protein n=1 Tax=Neisseria TaxID=482 RepID=UPI0008A5B347|nr:hypothetical protein HMPREF2872_00510 [Neisseria sp. HMSC069H12]OFR94754.1 hypothetical protein HMPREF2824_08695 [Neisseria sp. HMSC063B05]DAS55525.1 MAG TPA: hypothetical protein [Inoviridae sp.]DAS81994.1 MAG TPA: hypothetical protein [Inoviridae sp.]DAX47176.1 MAG TPA: hypothetical protein [Inoviridae sp.]
MTITRVYIVQSRETGDFLYPSDTGDVGHTPFVNEAGYFYDRNEAVETALSEIGENFIVFSFLSEF